MDNAFVVAPCGQDFNTSCNVLCRKGYYINGSSDGWTQTCQLNNELGVEWSDPPVCIGQSVCQFVHLLFNHHCFVFQPEFEACEDNPCKNNGNCTATDDGQELCTCGQLFKGSTCQIGLIQTPAFPILTRGLPSTSLKFVTNPTNGNLHLYPHVLDNNVLTFEPSDGITVVQLSGGAFFSVVLLQTGLFSIGYTLSGSATDTTVYETPENSLAVVTDNFPPAPFRYFTRGGLPYGQLGVGCCQYAYALPGYLCSSSLHLASSCAWSSLLEGPTATVETSGVVFLKTSNLDLPLSIAGIEVNSTAGTLKASVPIRSMGQTGKCSQCSECDNCQMGNSSTCHAFDHGISFDEYDISDMLTQHSLLKTFLNKTSGLLPLWLSTSISTLSITTFSSYDFLASINQPISAVELQGCGELTFENTGLIYVLRTRSPLAITISGQAAQLLPAIVSPLCFAIDICSGSQLTLEVVLQDKLTPPISDLNYFSTLSGLGWSFKTFSVAFTGLGVTTSISDTVFWNGETNIVAKLPSYDFKILTEFKGNLTGGNLMASHSFRGSLLHKSITISDEVSSKILDKLAQTV